MVADYGRECACVREWFDFDIHLFDQLPQEWQTHDKKNDQ